MEDLSNFVIYVLTFMIASSLLPLGVVMVVGLIVSFLQAIFSIQEQTFSFVIKNAVFLAISFLAFPWWFKESIAMFQRSFSLMAKIF